MRVRLQQMKIVVMVVSVCFLTVGCAGGKMSQCAGIIKVVNETVTQTKTITAAGNNGDLSTIEKSVGLFEKAARDMESVNVSDEKLKTFKGQFVAMYQGATTINKQLVASIKEKKLTKVNEGLRKSRDNFSPERDLATGITQYCKEPEK